MMRARITSVDYNSDWALKERFFHPKAAPGYMTREEVIAFYGTLGLDGVELMHSYWDDCPPVRVKQLLADARLPIAAYIFFVDLVVPTADRRPALDAAFALLDRTAELGAPLAMIVAATRPSDAKLDLQRGWLVDGLRTCAEQANAIGVTLVAENIDFPPLRPLIGRGADCRDLCAEVASPAFRLIYDACAPLFVEEDPLETLRVMAPYVVHVHVKNCRPLAPGEASPRQLASVSGRLYTGTALDTGLIDFRPILAELDRLGYDGRILLEYQGEEDPRIALQRSVAYLRELLKPLKDPDHD
jgi:sugar phosphate isomerase/epimerase